MGVRVAGSNQVIKVQILSRVLLICCSFAYYILTIWGIGVLFNDTSLAKKVSYLFDVVIFMIAVFVGFTPQRIIAKFRLNYVQKIICIVGFSLSLIVIVLAFVFRKMLIEEGIVNVALALAYGLMIWSIRSPGVYKTT